MTNPRPASQLPKRRASQVTISSCDALGISSSTRMPSTSSPSSSSSMAAHSSSVISATGWASFMVGKSIAPGVCGIREAQSNPDAASDASVFAERRAARGGPDEGDGGPGRPAVGILARVLSVAPPDEASTYETSHGRLVIWFPAPGVAAARITGHATGRLAQSAYELIDRQPTYPYEGF